jgi:hypothetical protein
MRMVKIAHVGAHQLLFKCLDLTSCCSPELDIPESSYEVPVSSGPVVKAESTLLTRYVSTCEHTDDLTWGYQ